MSGKRLEERIALVTGAGGGADGGIGAGIARCLGREGAVVAVNDLDEAYAEATVQQLKSMGVPACAVVGSVADSAQAEAMVQAVVQRFGRLDILVNNAGVGGLVPAAERLPDEIWLRTIAVDLTGPFYMCRAALPPMMARRYGRLINISSLAGQRTGFISGAPYTAAKSGLLGFTRHLAMEVAACGITVNAIIPGGVLTPRFRKKSPPERLATLAASYPTGRMADPEEIGAAVAFLASSEAGQISGVALAVDGGIAALAGNFAEYKAVSGKDGG